VQQRQSAITRDGNAPVTPRGCPPGTLPATAATPPRTTTWPCLPAGGVGAGGSTRSPGPALHTRTTIAPTTPSCPSVSARAARRQRPAPGHVRPQVTPDARSASALRRAEGNRRETGRLIMAGWTGQPPRFRRSTVVWQGQDSNLCRRSRRFYSRTTVTRASRPVPSWSRPPPITCASGLSTASAVTRHPWPSRPVPRGPVSGGGKSEGNLPPFDPSRRLSETD
jgi:hypothetical protein